VKGERVSSNDLAEANATVQRELATLSLEDLPALAEVLPRCDRVGCYVELRLAAPTEPVAAVVAWARALSESRVTGQEFDECIRLRVVGLLGGVRVVVRTRIDGPGLIEAGCYLSLPLDRKAHLLHVGVLAGLAKRRAAGHG
jgi:hypothetical protein